MLEILDKIVKIVHVTNLNRKFSLPLVIHAPPLKTPDKERLPA